MGWVRVALYRIAAVLTLALVIAAGEATCVAREHCGILVLGPLAVRGADHVHHRLAEWYIVNLASQTRDADVEATCPCFAASWKRALLRPHSFRRLAVALDTSTFAKRDAPFAFSVRICGGGMQYFTLHVPYDKKGLQE